MGKKLTLGCLGLGLLVLILGGYFIYTLLVKPVAGGISTLRDIHGANERIVNRAPYQPPATGEMTAAQVERFVSVQTAIRQGLQEKFSEFQNKYEEIGDDWERRDPTIREFTNVMGDALKLYAVAKRLQVNALNREGFSLEEYHFVRQSFYHALGVELLNYNLDLIAKAASEGKFDFGTEELEDEHTYYRVEVPPKNRELAAPYAESADEWIVFAWWGL
jgi:hypothetical protein